MTRPLLLNMKTSTTVFSKSPYNFDATIFKPSYYPSPMDVYEKGRYWFAMRLGGKIYGVRMEDRGTIRKPKVKVDVFSRSRLEKIELRKIIDELDFRFEFNRDISGFYRKFMRDKVLSPFLKRWYGMHGSTPQDLYGLLMIGIFLQNATVGRTVQMTRAMLEKYGTKVMFDGKEAYEFWKPQDMANVPDEELRECKVGYRAKIFVRLSKTFVEEKIDEFELRNLSVEEAKKKLMILYGVGPETARILLVGCFHYYDIYEHVAPWQQKILSRLLFGKRLVPAKKIIKYIKERWGEWAALAEHYIFEDIFWQRKQGRKIEWLEKEIRL